MFFDTGKGKLPLVDVPAQANEMFGRPMTLGARPEHLMFDDVGISARVVLAEPTGPDQYVRLAVAGGEMTARCGPEQAFEPGSDINIVVDGARMSLFDQQNGQALL